MIFNKLFKKKKLQSVQNKNDNLNAIYQKTGFCIYCRHNTYNVVINEDNNEIINFFNHNIICVVSTVYNVVINEDNNEIMNLYCDNCGTPVIVPSKAIEDLINITDSDILQ